MRLKITLILSYYYSRIETMFESRSFVISDFLENLFWNICIFAK